MRGVRFGETNYVGVLCDRMALIISVPTSGQLVSYRVKPASKALSLMVENGNLSRYQIRRIPSYLVRCGFGERGAGNCFWLVLLRLY